MYSVNVNIPGLVVGKKCDVLVQKKQHQSGFCGVWVRPTWRGPGVRVQLAQNLLCKVISGVFEQFVGLILGR